MRSTRFSLLTAFAPIAIVILTVAACSSTKQEGACVAVIDTSARSGGEARCGNGPSAGAACCVPSSGACAAGLPLCQTLCCTLPGEAGADAAPDAPVDASVALEASADAPSDGDAGGGQCPGNTKQKAPLVSAACQAAAEKHCCAQLTACFGIVPASGALDCNAFTSCIAACAPLADRAACEDDCIGATSSNVVDAYDAIVSCITANPATNSACR